MLFLSPTNLTWRHKKWVFIYFGYEHFCWQRHQNTGRFDSHRCRAQQQQHFCPPINCLDYLNYYYLNVVVWAWLSPCSVWLNLDVSLVLRRSERKWWVAQYIFSDNATRSIRGGFEHLSWLIPLELVHRSWLKHKFKLSCVLCIHTSPTTHDVWAKLFDVLKTSNLVFSTHDLLLIKLGNIFHPQSSSGGRRMCCFSGWELRNKTFYAFNIPFNSLFNCQSLILLPEKNNFLSNFYE